MTGLSRDEMGGILMTPERKVQLLDLIALCRRTLETEKRDISLSISSIYGLTEAELEDAGLGNLAYLLWHEEYCARGDVEGLLDLFELWVSKQSDAAGSVQAEQLEE